MNSGQPAPREIADGVYSIGAYRTGAYLQCNSYAVVRGGSVLLVDPGPEVLFEPALAALSQITDPARIGAFAATHPSSDAVSALARWRATGVDATLYAQTWTALAVTLSGYAGPIRHVHRRNVAEVHPVPGVDLMLLPQLAEHGMLCLYDRATGVLFTGDLFGAPDGSDSSMYDRMTAYNRRFLQHAETRDALQRYLRDAGVRTICPQHGNIVDLAAFDALAWIDRLAGGGEEVAATETVSLEQELLVLRQQNAELMESVVLANDARIKDDATGFYNETLLQEVLPTLVGDGGGAAVVLISVDEPAAGAWATSPHLQEQTMRALATEILHASFPGAFNFRFRGYSCAIVVPGAELADLRRATRDLANQIRDSEKFPQPTTVSVALAGWEDLQRVRPNRHDPIESVLGGMIAILEQLEEGGAEEHVELGSTIDAEDVGRAGGAVLVSPDALLGESLLAMLESREIFSRRIDNGADAAAWLVGGDEGEDVHRKPELVIAEMSVAQLDGFQLRELLLDDPYTRDIPFLLITDYKTTDVVERALAMGIEHIFAKPLNMNEIAGVCELIVRRNRS